MVNLIIPPWLKYAVPLALLAALSLWVWRIDNLRAHYKARLGEVTQEYAIFRAKIIDLTATELTRQKEIAHASDIKHDQEMADQRAATDRYIAAHRLRPSPSVHTGPAAKDGSASVPPEVSSDIIMDQADVRACGDLYTYALDAHDWAQTLAK